MKQCKIIFIIFFLFMSSLVKADGGDSPFHQFKKGTTQFLIADNVNIRNAASTDGKIIATIPIATKIEIVEKTDEVYTLFMLELPWYKIRFVENGVAKIGYVWGGLIAQEYFYDERNDNYFLFGIAGYNEDEGYKKIEFQLRVAHKNKEIDKQIVTAFPDFSSLSFKASDNRGVQGVENVLSIKYEADYCGGSSGEFYFFYNNKKLYLAKELTEGFDAPYYQEEKLIFPEDECGLPNCVLWLMSSGNAEEMESSDVDVKLYKWKNNELVEDK